MFQKLILGDKAVQHWLCLGCLLLFSSLLVACQTSQPSFECTDSIGCVTFAPGEPIGIGVLQSLTGGAAPGGTEQARTIELVMAQHDNQLLGHPIELQIEDSKCSPEGGANAALRIVVDPKMVAILGTNCSGAAVTASKIMSEAGLVMISSGNTAPTLTSVGGKAGKDWQPGYFRTIYNDAVMGRVAATFALKKLGVTKAAAIDAGDTYTQELTNVFQQVFTELGGQIVLETTINENETNQYPMLTAVALAEAELMFFPLSQPETSANIVRQVQDMPGLENLLLIGGEGMISDVFIEAVGPAGINLYFPGPAVVDSPANDALQASYEAQYGALPPSFYYTFAYDSTNMLLTAIESVAVVEEDGTVHIGRQALREALYATQGFEGLTGRLTCDEFGDCGAARLNIVQLTDPTAGVEGLKANVVYTYTLDSYTRK